MSPVKPQRYSPLGRIFIAHWPYLKDDAAHVLLAHDALLGGPLEGGNAGVLDLVQVLHSLGHIREQVGAGSVRAEAPDLLGQILVPAKLL